MFYKQNSMLNFFCVNFNEFRLFFVVFFGSHYLYFLNQIKNVKLIMLQKKLSYISLYYVFYKRKISSTVTILINHYEIMKRNLIIIALKILYISTFFINNNVLLCVKIYNLRKKQKKTRELLRKHY
ncbi:hypothetical protein EDEG_00223 [Edhazardia aedis USNM 41457]|uniref:Transmembrane protein n=1 Tax=Edhazardia aedis (strain USNM 41457) TaxID=1003232 RepID=J9D704_EDHAE|nr:hypothetical protein EDEG_00223 [Edhazardia aedis USNM 41457]|eukprot:EJW03314.1 hypothetical protein EDEG_00223 [Edhazardia aedis USNM 41457]